jgi:CheY-like chemotaxis protein
MKTVHLNIGNRIQVSHAVASEYAGSYGVIISIEERQTGGMTVTECDVEFEHAIRRRFLGFQLVRVGGNVGPTEQNRGIRVAVVEDNEDARELLSVALGDSFNVITYRSAEEALTFLLHEMIDVILVDLRLPDLDGIELLKQLRAAGLKTPAIMVTADVMGDIRDKAIAEGFSAFIPKPILDLQQLHPLIRDLAGQNNSAVL